MYGSGIGDLYVDIEASPGSGTWTNILTVSGDQGNVWNQVFIDLSAYSSTIKIRIKSVTGATTYGDIAIDNLGFICTEPCLPPNSVTASADASPVGPGTNVTFDYDSHTGGLCSGNLEYQWEDDIGTVLQAWSSTSSYSEVLNASVTYYLYMRCDVCPGSSTQSNAVVVPVLHGDDCSSIQDLAALTAPYSATTSGYSNSFSFCSMSAAADRIFYIDVEDGCNIEIWQVSNAYDSRHTMRYGGACPGTTEVDCIDGADTDPIDWTNSTGSTQRVYWINSGYSTAEGDFILNWTLNCCEAPTSVVATASSATVINGTDISLDFDSQVVGLCGSSSYDWEYEWRDEIGNVLQAWNTSSAYVETATTVGSFLYYLYVRCSGCTGSETQSNILTIDVVCTPPPDPGNPTASANVCGDKTLTFNGSPAAGVTWYWQSTCNDTDMSNSSNPNNVSTSATYYLNAYQASNSCWSAGCGNVSVIVEHLPTTPTINDTTVCPGDNSFYAYGSGTCAEYNWYDAPTGGTLLYTGPIFSTNIPASTSYYVDATNYGSLEVLLTASNSYVVDHNAATGDDRGGIAITQNYIYVTGDDYTSRLDLPLSLLTATSYSKNDGFFSDLSTGDLWELFDGTAIITGTTLAGYTVNSLRQLDIDLAYNGTSLTLSSSFTVGDQGGIYAGKGFVIIQDGDTNNFYHINLTTGDVTNLGIYTTTGKSVSEGWATYGIAELLDCEYYALYVDNSNDQIQRIKLTDGTITTAATFTNLNDMAAIGLSPWEDRWYFHHESASQFGGTTETVGYADAIITETLGLCTTSRDEIDITVTPAPLTPDGAAYPPAVFPGDDVILSATGSATLIWYDDKCEGNIIGTGSSITVTPPYSTNYFVASFDACYSECDTVPVQVVQPCGAIAYANGVVDTIQICAGDTIDLSANAGCDYMMMNDFNDGTIGVGWNSSCIPMYTNPCDASLDGTTYLWIGNDTDFPRELVTQEYVVTELCQICFDMDYATQGVAAPCEGIDLPNEGVHLQWSVDGGSTWTDVNYWDPLGGNDPQLTTWNNYCEYVPATAASSNTQFRFFQDVTSGFDFDHWGLDNVEISCPGNGLTVQWSHGSTELDPIDDVYPSTDITYTVIVDDGFNMGNVDTATIFIEVIGTPNVADDQICIPGGSATLIASGGTDYLWYDAATGGNLVGSNSSLIIDPLNSDQTYWVEFNIATWGPEVYDFNSGFDGWTASAPCTPPTTWVAYDDGTEKGIYAEDLGSQTSQLVLSPSLDVSMYDGNILFSVDHRFNTEECCDEGYIAYRLDGGSIQRLVLTTGSYSITNAALSLDPTTCLNSPTGDVYRGLQASYETHSGVVNVTGINTIEFGFLFSSDGSVSDDGWYINEVTVQSTGGSSGCPNLRAEAHALVGELDSDYSSENVSCYGSADGEATAIAVDGVGDPIPGIFYYDWPTGGISNTETGLFAGSYVVTITDEFGCTSEVTAIVDGPINPLSIADVTAVSGSCNIISPNNWVHITNSVDHTELIASVFDATGGNDLFLTTAEATIFASVQYYNTEPYLQRVVRVTPISSGDGIIKIYFTNAEFAALQIEDPSILSINDLAVTKCDDVGDWTNGVLISSSFSVSPIGTGYYAEVSVSSFSKFYIHKNNSAPLPVELIEFSAICEKENVNLSWKTTAEINNQYFSIEKSKDLIDFEEIGIVSGAGNSNEIINYSYLDKNADNTETLYYRIKQVDFDGANKYTEILSVNCKDDNIDVYAFVDRNSGNINLNTTGIIEDNCEIYLIDNVGKTLIQKTINLQNYQNNIVINNLKLCPSLYIVVLQTKSKIYTRQIVIAK